MRSSLSLNVSAGAPASVVTRVDGWRRCGRSAPRWPRRANPRRPLSSRCARGRPPALRCPPAYRPDAPARNFSSLKISRASACEPRRRAAVVLRQQFRQDGDLGLEGGLANRKTAAARRRGALPRRSFDDFLLQFRQAFAGAGHDGTTGAPKSADKFVRVNLLADRSPPRPPCSRQ